MGHKGITHLPCVLSYRFVETANLDGETNLKARSVFFDQSVAPDGTAYPTQDSAGNPIRPPFDPLRFKSVKVASLSVVAIPVCRVVARAVGLRSLMPGDSA